MMRDPRIEKWASLLVHHSLEAKPHQTALILGDLDALPLIQSCYEKFLDAKIHVEVSITYEDLQETFYRHADDTLLSHTPLLKQHAVASFDHLLFIYAPRNPQSLNSVPPERQAIVSKANQPIMKTVLNRFSNGEVRWCRTHYPTHAAAQASGLGYQEYEDFVMEAGYLHLDDPVKKWKEIESHQQKLIDYLSDKKELHFWNPQGTDLRVNIEGMKWANLCGHINFPDGEIFTGPNLKAPDGGVNGIVHYSFPSVFRHVEVDGIVLRFEKGKVVEAHATKNETFLHAMLNQDEGARYVGEIAIGTNDAIQKPVKDILYDEKIGGTFHTALGMGYPETGNHNQSGLHWDIVCDLRDGGTIKADGELLFI